MGTLGQCVKKTKMASRLVRVQSRQNLMMPEPRSLNLFTKKPPRKVPPPPAGTTKARAGPGGAEVTRTLPGPQPLPSPAVGGHLKPTAMAIVL
uniref:Uncharacterized protein n=1 Tax=Rhinolophus ferrumequinum TaxID=59479 RepID=A0A671FLU9_RHIFE